MKIVFIGILSILTLIGCATTSQYKAKLDTLVGQPEADLLEKWGKPTGRYKDENGDEVIAYIRSREVIVPGIPAISEGFNAPNQQVVAPGMPNSTIPVICMTKFLIKHGVVSSSTFKGNDCKSKIGKQIVVTQYTAF